ncbi:hypothetical protein J3R82DRAFT_10904 [Butyriboletus roseoflavus]|nr:hypothetical protein J3R82DRAFT_10904 [Butyriboletus roseoflavus]
MDCPSTSFPLHDHHPPRSHRPLFATHRSHYPEHEAKFDVQVRVQRSFSFEELQSGSYFSSLDESDLQFYRVYGQPVFIPPPDHVDGNFIVHGTYPTSEPSCDSLQNNRLHLDPPVLTSKSYTLQNPLGEGSARSHSTYREPQLPPPCHDWQLIKQEPSEGVTTYYNPALSCHLYTLPDQDDADLTIVTSPSDTSMQHVDDQKPLIPIYDEPPMDSLPYPPPANSASPPYFSVPPPSQAMQDLGSPPFIHDASFQMNTARDHWEDSPARAPRLTIPTHSYMLSELPSPAFSQSLPQQYPSSSVTRSHRRHSRSPSPRSPLRMSPAPHTKRSLDKKPALACLFCRGRKIACGPPQPGSKDKTCK